MSPLVRSNFSLFLLWLALLVTALLVRPLLPVDETRYLSVAWEMWQRGEFLVPQLNGKPYSDKPPLLFWLFHAGWLLGGVNEWWPRLVSPIAALLNLYLTAHLARLLWPDLSKLVRTVPWVLLGSLVWAGLYTLVQFDQFLVLSTLLVLIGILGGTRGSSAGWWLAGFGLGLGLLSKGPVIFLHVMPAALLAPWWVAGSSSGNWRPYYGKLIGVLLLGLLIALLWAVPAGIAGGVDYRDAIFWHQTAGRTGAGVVHQQVWWWYMALLPVAMLPWTIWPPVWKAWYRFPALLQDTGMRFCLAWFVPGIILFSLVGSKQVKYLLPLLPALALMLARVLQELSGQDRLVRLSVPGLLLAFAGILIALLPWWGPERGLPDWSADIHWGWGAGLTLCGVIIALLPRMPLDRALMGTAATTMLLVFVVHTGIISSARPAYDLSVISARISALQDHALPLLNVAKYHGQYHFLGRLSSPLEAALWDAAPAWARQHPDGFLLVYYKQAAKSIQQADYIQPYRGGSLVLWKAQLLLDHPGWLRTLPEK